MISIRTQIATAVRWANTIYSRLPDDRARDQFAALWLDLARTVDTAEAAGDFAKVETAISEWREALTAQFQGVDHG